jgi:hypothetical protein
MSNSQMKERPASMLRAMFAGLGSLLGVMDKVRSKSAAQAPAAQAPPAVAAEPELAAAEAETAPVEPVAVAVVETEVEVVTIEPVPAPEPEPAAAAEPEPVLPEPVAAEPGPVPADAATPLPLANYDDLSIASLRARLRTLSVGQLTQLLDYERGHAARADVISMFERRIAKVQAES